MAGLGRKLRSISRESFQTSPSISFDLKSVQQRSENNLFTSSHTTHSGKRYDDAPRSKQHGARYRNKSQMFHTVAEENEDDPRLLIPSQREVSKSKSTRLS